MVNAIAKRRNISVANVLLSCGIQRGWSVIPKSTNKERIRINLLGCYLLNTSEMDQINELYKTKGRRFNRPDWGTTMFHDDEGTSLA